MPRTKTGRRAANGAGSIKQRIYTRNGKTYKVWEARVTVGYDPASGRQIQKYISGKTQKEVQAKMNQLLADVSSGKYREPSPDYQTVEAWLKHWWQTYLDGVKPSTANLYSQTLAIYVVPRIGAVKLKDLNTDCIQKIYHDLLHPSASGVKPLSENTVRNIHAILRRALQKAVEVHVLSENPASACVLPKGEKWEFTPLDDDQICEFLKMIENHVHEYLYKITMFTGLREGEVLGLTWDCIDFDRKKIIVCKQLCKEKKKGGQYYFSSTKNKKPRELPIKDSIVGFFRCQKVRQMEMQLRAGPAWNNAHNLVFTNDIGGFLSYRTVYDCLKRIVRKMGHPEIRFHDLRHTYATMCIDNGDAVTTLQRNLGHATAEFTMDFYGHATDQMCSASADKMEARIERLCGSIRG